MTSVNAPRQAVAVGSSEPVLSMNIGPTRLAAEVRVELGRQPAPLYEETFLLNYRQCLRLLRQTLGCSDQGAVLVTPGSGTMAMEAAVVSMLPAGASVVVASTGMWGDRWADICRRLGLQVRVVTAAPGEAVVPAALRTAVAADRCAAVLLTHVDSSSGVRTDLEELSRVAHESGALVLVDGVSAAGAEVVDQARRGIDVYVTGSGKALSAAAGVSVVALGERATAELSARAWPCPSYSLDLRPWLTAMSHVEAGQFSYHQTPASSLIYGLAESLRMIAGEGLAARVARHEALRNQLHRGLEELGITLLVVDPVLRANGVTVCWTPRGETPHFLHRVRNAGVTLPAGVHPGCADRTFRIGHLGNVTVDDVSRTLAAVGAAAGVRSIR